MRTRGYLYACAILSGVLVGLSVILPEWVGMLEWVALVPFFLFLLPLGERVCPPKRYFFTSGFLFYLAYGLTYFHWFWALYPLDFTGLNGAESIVVILFAWVGLSTLYALLGGALFLVPCLLGRLGIYRRVPMVSVLTLPAIFVLYEFILTLDWWGVPWGKLALGQTFFLPTLQSASLLGSYFITALLVLTNASLAFLLVHRGRALVRALPFVATAVLVVLNTTVGVLLYERAPTLEENQRTVKIAVLQGNNASQEDITDPESFQRYIDLSEDAALAGADVILWPESSIAGAIFEHNYFGLYASEFARVYEVYLIIGSTTYRDGNEYNTMTLFDREGRLSDYYDKRTLVPFGEFVPYRDFFEVVIPPLVEVTMLDGDCSAGDDASIFEREDIGRLGGLICFESIYERLALATVRQGAEVFIVGTNDSWFRESRATKMHTAHEQLRSIECGRYSARAACTGLTCFINARGEIVDSLPLYEEGFLVMDVPRLTHTTLYARLGDLVVPTSALLLFSLCLISLLRKEK